MNNLVDTLFKQYIERVYKEQLPLPEVQITVDGDSITLA